MLETGTKTALVRGRLSRLVTPRSGEFVDIGMLQGFYCALVTLTPAVDTLYCWPFFVDQPMVIETLNLEITTLEADKVFRVGVYTDSQGRPGTLLAESGELSAATTGNKQGTITGNLVLAPGTYWAAILGNWTGTAAVRAIQGAARVILPIPNSAAAATTLHNARKATVTYAALPATAPSTSGDAASPARVEFGLA